MSKKITIEPVTRVEGHAKITIHLNDDNKVDQARLHITQIRGFEKFSEGRPFSEMPSLVARICGICPVSHLLAGAKACDALLAVKIPPTAAKLRRILNDAQFVQSHALSFFHLSSPDLLMGFDSDPAKRHILGVAAEHPQRAKDGIALRRFGQTVIELLGGKRIHPSWVVPGGVNQPLSAETREKILELLPEAMSTIERTLDWYKSIFENFRDEIRTFGNFPSMFLGLVTPEEDSSQIALAENYDGVIRVVDSSGNIKAKQLDPSKYYEYIGEAVEPYSYMKMPYYKPDGYPQGMYRVGPLARLNIIDRMGTPKADLEWTEFRALRRSVILSSFHYLYARLIEILFCIEQIEQLLNEPDILDTHVRSIAGVNAHEGVGVTEAPRGTLIHHYKIDDDGLMTWANMIVASGHNNLAMNQSITQVAKHYLDGNNITEGMLNRIEAVIRNYDPCFSCASHAVGSMPMSVELVDAGGKLVDKKNR